jgi:hypothetical protein
LQHFVACIADVVAAWALVTHDAGNRRPFSPTPGAGQCHGAGRNGLEGLDDSSGSAFSDSDDDAAAGKRHRGGAHRASGDALSAAATVRGGGAPTWEAALRGLTTTCAPAGPFALDDAPGRRMSPSVYPPTVGGGLAALLSAAAAAAAMGCPSAPREGGLPPRLPSVCVGRGGGDDGQGVDDSLAAMSIWRLLNPADDSMGAAPRRAAVLPPPPPCAALGWAGAFTPVTPHARPDPRRAAAAGNGWLSGPAARWC